MLLALRTLWEPAPTTAFPNAPGRVYKGTYPHWQKPYRKPFWQDDEELEENEEEEEVVAMIEMEID